MVYRWRMSRDRWQDDTLRRIYSKVFEFSKGEGMEKYRLRIEELAKRLAGEMHLALYDLEEKATGKGKVIVVFITKLGGVTLDECAVFSHRLSEELDSQDFITEHYYLEVSSPGIERPLRLKTHYISAINEQVEIQWQSASQRLTSKGKLVEVNPDSVVILEKETRLEIPFSAIHKARTCFIKTRTREQA